jgi:hypothetical protein
MATRRIRRYTFIGIGLLLLPPALWCAVLLVAPTGWAKRHVVAAIEARTGRSVRLQGLSVQPLGGIRLANLEIGAPGDVDDPWLKAATIQLEISPSRLFSGKFEPTVIDAGGVTLRVLRRADGSFELADFLLPPPEPKGENREYDRARAVMLRIHAGAVTVIDEPSQTRLIVHNLEGEAVREGERLVITQMHGTLNGGPFQFAGALDRGIQTRAVEGRMRVDDAVLDDGMSILRYAVPVLAGAPLHLKGQIDAEIDLAGQGGTWDQLVQSLRGKGVIAIDPVDLDGAPLIAELSKVARLSRQARVASIRTDFVVKDRRIATDHFTLNVGSVPMTLSGWTDFDGKLDYRVNLAGIDKRIPDEARRFLGEMNVKLERLNLLTLQGTVNKMVVQINGLALDQKNIRMPRLEKEDRDKLKGMARQFLEQISR